MTSVAREHSIFYKPGPVPLPALTLTAHTIIRFASAPPTITAHIEVRSTPSKPQIRKPTPEPQLPRVRFDSVTSHRSSVTRSTDDGYESSLANSSDDATGSDLTALSSENEEERQTIPKPLGAAGRPKSGGYNLKRAARLKEFDNIKQYVAELIEESSEINTKHSFKAQNLNAFKSVYQDTQAKYPELYKFDGCWPIEDMLKNYLKNSSSKWRKLQSKKLSEQESVKGKVRKEKKKAKSSRKSPII